MSVTQAVLTIVGAAAAGLVAWYLKKLASGFIQRYRDRVNKDELEKARRDAQDKNQRDNAESDKLRKIDGR